VTTKTGAESLEDSGAQIERTPGIAAAFLAVRVQGKSLLGSPPQSMCSTTFASAPSAAHGVVDGVDTRPCDANLHLAGPGLGYFANLELVDVAVASENSCTHRVLHRYCLVNAANLAQPYSPGWAYCACGTWPTSAPAVACPPSSRRAVRPGLAASRNWPRWRNHGLAAAPVSSASARIGDVLSTYHPRRDAQLCGNRVQCALR
jgi:hypothetical protein